MLNSIKGAGSPASVNVTAHHKPSAAGGLPVATGSRTSCRIDSMMLSFSHVCTQNAEHCLGLNMLVKQAG